MMVFRVVGPAVPFTTVVLSIALMACDGSSSHQRPEPRSPNDLKGTSVYDSQGRQHACQPPGRDCPPIAPDREFLDACQLAGYRVMQCGCESMCTGKLDDTVYDAQGRARACGQKNLDCAPPPVSAAFQDACAERGYRLVQCGCELVCTGDPTK